MYCINCGVKLADTEKSCPLCGTVVYHPDIKQGPAVPLYPSGYVPKPNANSKALNGIYIILFLMPVLVCFLADFLTNGCINWFGYAAGGLILTYFYFVFPHWFKRPNPVIFVPCDFALLILYLLYINLATGGRWFMSCAFPVAGAIGLITSAVVTLLYYLKKGRLYVWGGASMAIGGLMMLIEFLLHVTGNLPFSGWSVYPLIVLVLFGGMLIYLAVNSSAREALERKLFF